MTNGKDIDQSATYEIKVKGNLDPSWSEWFDGFTITIQGGETILVGVVCDQSALHGILAKINDLGLAIVSVKQKPGLKGLNHGKNGDPYSITDS